MKILALILLVFFISLNIYGQNCSCISRKKDKNKGIETVSGIVNSKEFYSLLFQKQINFLDTAVKSKYILYLHVASRVTLNDSMLNVTGTFELKLLDNSIIKVDSVKYLNNPLGICCSLGFKSFITDEQFKFFVSNPIVSITILNNLTATFNNKQQIEQSKIINCLITR